MPADAAIRKLTDSQAESLIRLYERGEARIEAQINQALLRGADPAYLEAVRGNIKTAREELLAGSRAWCQSSIPLLYREGVAYADGMAFSSNLLAGFGSIHQQAAQTLADATYSRMIDVDGVIGRRVDDIFRAVQLESAEGAVLGRESVKQSAKVMKEELAKRGVTGFVDKAGRRWSMSTYTEMAVHDATMNSFREGTRLRLLEHGYDLVVISSHLNACEKCTPWEGRTLSLTGATDGYPTLGEARGAGLFHGRCRHVYTLSPEEGK
ncbi:MAG: phage minor capsid protein [Methanothrix sp.]